MEGVKDDRGINYRTLEQLFKMKEDAKNTCDYSISLQMVEIYNETVKDLLYNNTNNNNNNNDNQVIIREGKSGVYLQGAKSLDISTLEEVYAAINIGNTNRSVGKTNSNEHSSRSHSILLLDIYSNDDTFSNTNNSNNNHDKIAAKSSNGNSKCGRIVLVDLAGSERLKKTLAVGDRLKEAQHINKSLSALGDVISSLSCKTATHIPYRNSKLTYLLKDSLGSGNKALMVVQVSPAADDVYESLCSLKFATRVQSVQLNKGKANITKSELNKLKSSLESNIMERKKMESNMKKFKVQFSDEMTLFQRKYKCKKDEYEEALSKMKLDMDGMKDKLATTEISLKSLTSQSNDLLKFKSKSELLNTKLVEMKEKFTNEIANLKGKYENSAAKSLKVKSKLDAVLLENQNLRTQNSKLKISLTEAHSILSYIVH